MTFRFPIAAILLSCVACSSDDSSTDGSDDIPNDVSDSPDAAVDPEPEPFGDLSELVDNGIDEFAGLADPVSEEVVDGVTVYEFDPADGPVCLRGAPYNVSVRDQSSENLLIYLQGGGACFPFLCASRDTATRGIPSTATPDRSGGGILDDSNPDNPIRDWNVVYVPYCDGSVFIGDSIIEEGADDQGARTHHGLRNFQAALDLAVSLFPDPDRVLLAGTSAGGFGTVYLRPLVRLAYPAADFYVFNDAGIGINTRLEFMVDTWNSGRFAPASCADCATSVHATPIAKWFFENDSNVRVGLFTSWEDNVIRAFSQPDPALFREMVAEETRILADAFPDRYKRFIIEGEQHTTLLESDTASRFHETAVDGTTAAQWLGAMVEDDPVWTELIE